MKKLLIFSLLFLVAGVFLAGLIKNDAGYVIVSYGTKTYEMTLWFSFFVLMVLLASLWLCMRLFGKTVRSVVGSVSWISETKSKKASKRTQEGLVNFIEGNWRDAKRNLLSAAKNSDTPLVHYLASARSAYELGDAEETQRLLLKAEEIAPQNSLAILLSQARIQLADKKYEQSLATLERARNHASNHPVVLDLLRQVYWQLSDWQALIELLPALRGSQQLTEQEFTAFEESLFVAYLSSIVGNGELLDLYSQAWQRVPKHLKTNVRLICHYVQLLLKNGFDSQAETLLRTTLAKVWAADLVNMYGQAKSAKPREQLVVAEKWLRQHSGDAELLAALGRISMRNELWGKARSYFESSLQLRERPDIYAELAALLAQLGEHEKSTRLYQKGLLLSTSQTKA